jgi:TolB-like protein
MPTNPNKLSQFWQELKRRRVLRSLAIYAGSAFIILEATTILFPRWDLPDWSIDLVFWLLVLGAIINVFVAWVFDITPQGIQKTKSIEEVVESERRGDSKGWKAATYLSLVVIVALIVYNVISTGNTVRAGEIQSIVILPFENYTGDDQLDNLVSSMHSLLCTDIGRISELRVISKTTSKLYGGSEMSANEIAEELNVDGVVEGSIMCLGDSVCMRFSLISTTGEEQQIWIGDYNEDKGQVLNLYNRITKRIAEEVRIELTEEEEEILDRNRAVDREAFDTFLKSYSHMEDLSEEGLTKALELLAETIEKDPEWAPPYAALATVWAGLSQMSFVPRDFARPIIWDNINKALELDPDLSELNFAIGIAEVWTDWNWENGEKAFLKALAINPNDVMSRMYYAHLLVFLQRTDEALVQGRLAVDLDPLNPLIQSLYAPVLSSAGDWEAAQVQLEKVLTVDPKDYFANNLMEVVAYHCDDYDKVFESVKNYLPFEDNVMKDIERIFNEQGFVIAYEEMLRQMELMAQNNPGVIPDMAIRYGLVNQYDKAMDWIETLYQTHNPNMPYLVTGYVKLDSLYDNPRFITILGEMNLPIPGD